MTLLTADWLTVATRRTKSASWEWKIDELARIIMFKRVDLREVETRLHRAADGAHEMQARDTQEARRKLGALVVPIEPLPIPAAPVVPAVATAAVRRRQAGPMRLPPARRIAGPTYAPYAGEPASW